MLFRVGLFVAGLLGSCGCVIVPPNDSTSAAATLADPQSARAATSRTQTNREASQNSQNRANRLLDINDLRRRDDGREAKQSVSECAPGAGSPDAADGASSGRPRGAVPRGVTCLALGGAECQVTCRCRASGIYDVRWEEMVELRGFEPLTPRLPALCSPN